MILPSWCYEDLPPLTETLLSTSNCPSFIIRFVVIFKEQTLKWKPCFALVYSCLWCYSSWRVHSPFKVNNHSVNLYLTSWLSLSYRLHVVLHWIYTTYTGMGSVLKGIKAPRCWTVEHTAKTPDQGVTQGSHQAHIPAWPLRIVCPWARYLTSLCLRSWHEKRMKDSYPHVEKVKVMRGEKVTCATEFIVIWYSTVFFKLWVEPSRKLQNQFTGS